MGLWARLLLELLAAAGANDGKKILLLAKCPDVGEEALPCTSAELGLRGKFLTFGLCCCFPNVQCNTLGRMHLLGQILWSMLCVPGTS